MKKQLLLLSIFVLMITIVSAGCVEETVTHIADINDFPTPEDIQLAVNALTEDPLSYFADITRFRTIDEAEKEIEGYIFDYINEERVKYNLIPFTYDEKLSELAKAHSIDMGANGYFDTTNLQGLSPTQRAHEAGYTTGYKGIAEEINEMPIGNVNDFGYLDKYNTRKIARAIVTSSRNEYGVSSFICDSSFRSLGVGVIYHDESYYATVDYW